MFLIRVHTDTEYDAGVNVGTMQPAGVGNADCTENTASPSLIKPPRQLCLLEDGVFAERPKACHDLKVLGKIESVDWVAH